MKRIISILIVAVFMFSLTACGDESSSSDNTKKAVHRLKAYQAKAAQILHLTVLRLKAHQRRVHRLKVRQRLMFTAMTEASARA